jgi:predicted DCC family thiol-disulfide oxidoreductase YuxK
MKPILFYDGHCALCHGLVRWVLDHDPGIFTFAPLQGETFKKLGTPASSGGRLESLIVRDGAGNLHSESEAVIFVLKSVGFVRFSGLLAMLPRVVRDLGYRFIARIRYSIFGRTTEMCPLIPPELRSRFLE